MRIPEDVVPTLRAIFDRGPTFLRRIAEAIERTGPSLDTPDLRAVAVCRKLDDSFDVDEVARLLDAVINPIGRVGITHGVTVEDVLQAVDERFSDDNGGRDAWRACREAFRELLALEVIAIEAKAGLLLESRSHAVEATRIYSDLRPLFDSEEEIRAIVLTNTLRIRTGRGPNGRWMSFALDPAGLLDLRAQVDRAIRKNEALLRGCGGQDRPILFTRDAEPEVTDSQ